MTKRINLQHMIQVPFTASVQELVSLENDSLELIKAAIVRASNGEQAELSPIGDNGHPRMLQISGWLCHADLVNGNRFAFTQEDLRDVVANGMFAAPFFGMIDFNHDFSSYGVWYKTEYRYDEKAKAYGIYAEGAIFAWRYTELADKLLATQQRKGYLDLSMACIPEHYEYRDDAEGDAYRVGRKPVFFTTSVLDVEPADKHARAVGSEDPGSSADDRRAELEAASDAGITTESKMDTKEEETHLARIAALERDNDKLQADLTELKATVKALDKEIATRDAVIAATQTKVEELEVSRDEAVAKVKSLEEESKAAELAAQKERRLKELPKEVLEQVDGPDNAELLEDWLTMEEAKWEAVKRMFGSTKTARKSFADRSEEEGSIPGTTDHRRSGSWAIVEYIER